MSKINIFNINDVDWYAGETEEQVKKAYYDDNLNIFADFENIDIQPKKLTEEQLDSLSYYDSLGDSASSSRTFREQLDLLILANTKFPCFFATTEY